MADGTLKVGTITTSSGSGTITLGQSGETVNIPTGATITGFGASNAFMTNGMSGNASGTLVFNNVILDDGGNYNTSNGRYTAPSDGKYIFFFHALSAGSGSNIYFEVNGSTLGGMGAQWGYTHSGADPDTVTAILNLSQNDYVTAVAQSSVLASYIFFGGAKLY